MKTCLIFSFTFSLLLAFASTATPSFVHNALSSPTLHDVRIIPSAISVPPNHRLQIALHGVGFQHYAFNGSSWILRNATAKLYTLPHKKSLVGRHFFLPAIDAKLSGQPSWKTFNPYQSQVTAKTVDSVSVDSDSITWNLLQSTNGNGNKNLLGAVTYVQRIRTKKGLPPSFPSYVGASARVSYSADYLFYVKDNVLRSD